MAPPICVFKIAYPSLRLNSPRTMFARHITTNARRAMAQARNAAEEFATLPPAPHPADDEPSLSPSDDDEDPEGLPPMPPPALEDQDSGGDDDDRRIVTALSPTHRHTPAEVTEVVRTARLKLGKQSKYLWESWTVTLFSKSHSVTSLQVSAYQSSKPTESFSMEPRTRTPLQDSSRNPRWMLLFQKEHLNDLRILVVERVKMFHRWLNDRHGAGVSLIGIALDGFTDQAMATLVEADSRGSVKRERDGASGKGAGLSLPTFNGVMSQYKVWNQKWRAYLGTMKNADGIPLLYVIVDALKETASVRHQIEGANLKGARFETDNFKVSQLLESALADGSASIYSATHQGDGRRAYLDLDRQYDGKFRRETRVQEITAKLKTLQYRCVKNFPWDKFTNVLLAHYNELNMLHAGVGHRTQVRNLVEMIIHERTRNVAAEIVASDRRARKNLKRALAKIGERMQLLGVMTASTGDGGPQAPTSRHIKMLKRKVKSLEKKAGKPAGGFKPNKRTEDKDDYIPQEVLDAITKAGGEHGGKFISYMLKGKKDSRSVKGLQTVTEDDQVEDTTGDDTEEVEVSDDGSASSAFGRGASNRHLQNPNKKRKQGSLHVVSYQISKTVATPVENPTDFDAICRSEIDSRADTVCCGKSYRMIEQSPRVATVSGFHGDLGAVNNVPIGNCCTAIDHPDLQETLIVVCNEALYFGAGMEDSLISPNQLRANGLIVDTCPKQYSNGKSMHGIYDPHEDIFIPFRMHGCISYFASRLPTDEELATCRRNHFYLRVRVGSVFSYLCTRGGSVFSRKYSLEW